MSEAPAMKITILTIFPEMFESVLNSSILGRARAQGILEIHQGLLDTGILAEDLGFKWFLAQLRFAEGELPIPSDKRPIAGTIAMGSASRGPFKRIDSRLLEGFGVLPKVQEPRDDTAHPLTLAEKIIFDTR